MRIFTDDEGRYVNAISKALDQDVEGTLYYMQAGADSTVLQFKSDKQPGITNEMLVAVLIHRMGVLNGKNPSPENDQALEDLAAVKAALDSRESNKMT